MLKDKIAVVTGGSRGIGRAICVDFARHGASVLFCYSGNVAAAEETLKLCKEFGADAVAVQADVGNREDVDVLIQTALERFGRIDILVNNAGITKDNMLLRMKEADFDKVIETNLKGTFLTMKAVTKTMMKQRFGRIINISSVVALQGNAGQANYCASKAGIIGMTKSLAKELASRGITVNAVAPGLIETDMTQKLAENITVEMTKAIPMGRAGKPEEIASVVSFLASSQASYITGQVLAVDGGMAM